MIIRCLPLILFLGIFSCTKQVLVPPLEYPPIYDPGKYNMKIIPLSPTSTDNVRLVLFEDCQYNLLDGVTKTGNIVNIEKHFNSMMKLPCMLRNDTIIIG